MRLLLSAALLAVTLAAPAAALPPTSTPLQALAIGANTGEKPQSKVWNHDGRWWCVLPNATGTWIWRLDGNSWTNVHQLSSSTTVKADVKPVGGVVHVLLYNGTSSALASAEYVLATQTYQAWSGRPANSAVTLDSGVETATLEMDSQGRLWLASDEVDEIRVRYSDAPYSSWSAPINLVTGINTDDICVVTALPGGSIGVLWSNQTTQRFGFRTHVDGTDPMVWTADEVPAAASALNVGLGQGDDHMNFAVASDGTLYAAVKTSYDTAGFPKIALLVRRPAGTWDDLYEVSQTGTRGICLLDESAGKVTVVYTSVEGSGNIIYKESPTAAIAFGPTPTTLLSGAYNEVTSTRQTLNGEVVILASTTSGPLQAVGVLLQAAAVTHTITASAGVGGSIAPSGPVVVADGANQAFVITPDAGYHVANVLVDGGSVGAVAGHTFTNVTADHTIAAAFSPDPSPSDLIGWWTMEEGSGSTILDVSGSGHHGTLPNGALWVPGFTGTGLELNGTNQSATVPDDASLDLTTGITMAAWIKPNLFATQDLIKKGVNGGTNGYELSLSAPSSSWPQKVFVRFNQVTSGDTYRINSTTLYPLNGSTWMHVAATYDGAMMRLYINGALEGSLAMPGPIATNANPLRIGAQSDGARPFQGTMDDVRLYDRALDGSEIQALLGHTLTYLAGPNGSITGTSPQLVAHGGSGTAVSAVANPSYHFTSWSDGVLTASRTESNVQSGLTVTASFALDAPGASSTVDVGPPAGPITTADPVRTVPVTINRTDLTPLLAFSVKFKLSPPLSLSGGTGGVHQGTYLSAANPTTAFNVIDLGVDGLGHHEYQVDAATLGPPCGASAASGTLFTIDVASAAAAGSGSVTITSLTLRDCSNADLPGVIGTSATVTVDQSVPSVQLLTPNGGENWRVGSSQAIQWTGSDAEGVAGFDLAYSTDGGTTYPNAIASVPGGQTSYAWTIPAAPGTATRVRVTAHDTNGNSAADASDANFTIAYYTLSYLAGAGGTISGTTPQSVGHGGSGTAVTAVPDVGHHFVSWSDGVLTASRTDTNVLADLTVTASFAPSQFTLTYLAGANGSISGTTPQTVNTGGSGTAVTAVANPGYHFVSWSDGVLTASRTDTNVLANLTVTASFLVNPPVAMVTNLVSTQVRPGSPGSETTPIQLTWDATPPGTTVQIWRKGFGGYPEYDDAGGAVPSVAASYPPGPGWVNVVGLSTPGGEDLPPTRDYYYYVAFAQDGLGTWSPPSALTAGTLDYHLGDVSNGLTPGSGNNRVFGEDVSLLGANYGLMGAAIASVHYLDVGPTTTAFADGRPMTDNLIEFEDLVMFAINYSLGVPGQATAPTASAAGSIATDELILDAPDRVSGDRVVEARLTLRGSGSLIALSTVLSWDSRVVEPVGQQAGAWLAAAGGQVFSARPGSVDAAAFRAGGLAGEGELAVVRFRVLAAGEPRIRISSLDGRDARNRKVDVKQSQPVLAAAPPVRTQLALGRPNPFRESVSFSFSLSSRGMVQLSLFSVDGRQVRSLVRGDREPGEYDVQWDGRDDQGRAVEAGMYYARLETARGRFSRTVIHVK